MGTTKPSGVISRPFASLSFLKHLSAPFHKSESDICLLQYGVASESFLWAKGVGSCLSAMETHFSTGDEGHEKWRHLPSKERERRP